MGQLIAGGLAVILGVVCIVLFSAFLSMKKTMNFWHTQFMTEQKEHLMTMRMIIRGTAKVLPSGTVVGKDYSDQTYIYADSKWQTIYVIEGDIWKDI